MKNLNKVLVKQQNVQLGENYENLLDEQRQDKKKAQENIKKCSKATEKIRNGKQIENIHIHSLCIGRTKEKL